MLRCGEKGGARHMGEMGCLGGEIKIPLTRGGRLPEAEEEGGQVDAPLGDGAPEELSLRSHERAEAHVTFGARRLDQLCTHEHDEEREERGDAEHLLRAHRLEQGAREVGGGESAHGLAAPAERLQRARASACLVARALHHERVDDDIAHGDAKRCECRREHGLRWRLHECGEREPGGGADEPSEDEVALPSVPEERQPVAQKAVERFDDPR